MSDETRCAVCNVLASLKCMACKAVYYCGKEHQKIHWRKGHKHNCRCYEIVTNNVLGRHLRATRDIKCGELILCEKPLIYGPKIVSVPVCLGCHRQLTASLNENYYKCQKCNWPLCSKDCETSSLHRDECDLMTKSKFLAKIDYQKQEQIVNNAESKDLVKKESAYCVILPLRCILLKEKKPDLYEKFLLLQDHLNEWLETPLYQLLKCNLVQFIQRVLGLTEYNETEILRIAARLDTNAFEVRLPLEKCKIRAIYPTAAMFSHDCLPNARHTFTENLEIIFIAKTDIRKGEIISTTYTQLLNSTPMRNLHLAQSKHFKCQCKRCSDPKELGLYIGAILCTKCHQGKIISTDPLQDTAKWQCELCGHYLSAKQINLGNESLKKEISLLNKKTPKQFEEFLLRYNDILHPTNTFVLQVKYALTQLYGNTPGFLLHEMNAAAINRKVELCRELLTVADLIDGGWSIFRGQLLLDLQEALSIQTKQQYLNGLLTEEGAQERLMESMNLWKECTEIMKMVPHMNEILYKRTMQLANEL